MRHVIKISLLVLGLGFLFWWGWWGNFIFNPGAIFKLSSGEEYYTVSMGGRELGFARRIVSADNPESGFTVMEESLIQAPLPAFSGEIRLRSEASYGPDGRLIAAVFTVPGLENFAAIARVRGNFLDYELSFGATKRLKTVALPREGPILVSGIIPWLSRQREAPLGKVLLVSVFDPVASRFQTGELTIEDTTEASEEIQMFKVSLTLPAGETNDWLDASGRLIRQRQAKMDAGLDLLAPGPKQEEAKTALEKEVVPITLPPRVLEFLPSIFENLPSLS
ncbi:MAG: hypothetical protein LBF22_14625 [Deltaproteobacteria bacterium]|jgi:hypothetical protein|nr:hypothetical protein [Deltaproteobacteria bacterium]